MIDSNLPIFISVADLGSFSRAGCQLKKKALKPFLDKFLPSKIKLG